MRIAAASDVHGLWCGLDYPEADLLVFAGDIFGYYDRDKRRNANDQLEEIKLFDEFLKTVAPKYRKILCVAGNHDFVFERHPEKAKKLLTQAIYLQDEAFEFEEYKIWGTPWQPWFGGWAFNFPNHHENFFRARAHARNKWDEIPSDTSILISHTPPLGILDATARGDKAGCQYLAERIEKLPELLLHIFGHIHAGYGHQDINGLLSANVAVCYTHNKLSNPITLIDIDENGLAKAA